MSFATALSNDLSVFFNTDEFAEEVSYTPTGGVATDIDIIDDTQNATLQSTESPSDSKIILIKYSDVNMPLKGDIITWDSETWYVKDNLSGGQTEGIWRLEIGRSAWKRI